MNKGENIKDIFDGSMKRPNYDLVQGSIMKGSNLNEIMSISTQGLVSKKIFININSMGTVNTFEFYIKNPNKVAQDIKNAKDSFEESIVVEAKRVIIEGGTKDKAMEILKKRLARGEITLDEFHRVVQRL